MLALVAAAVTVLPGQSATAAGTGTLTKSGRDLTTGSTTAVNGGDTVQYTFTVTNTGNVTLHDVTLTDKQDAPAGKLTHGPTCPTTTLAPGEHVACTATYRVTKADIDHNKIVDHATVTADPPTGDPVTAIASATVHVAQIIPVPPTHNPPHHRLAWTGVPAEVQIAAAVAALVLGVLLLLAGARRRRP